MLKNYNTTLTRGLTLILAAGCGIAVANIYYSQTLISLIGTYLHLNHTLTSFIVTLTQIGYGAGLIFIVPMGDLTENRRLIFLLLCASAIALIGILLAQTSWVFLTFSFLLGLTSVSAQVIVPFAAHLSSEESRGKTVGNIVSGLSLGVMLARPLASWLADLFMWKAVFILSLFLVLIFASLVLIKLPRRQPQETSSYAAILTSLLQLWKRYLILRRRSTYHAFLFGAFSLFWTSIALLLLGPNFHYTQGQVALFAFAGISGILAAPLAGRLADRGYSRSVTGAAMMLVALAFLLANLGKDSIVALLFAAILLDAGVCSNLVLGQRAIYMLAAAERGRLNGIYLSTFFIGGAVGSALSGFAYAKGGWIAICNIGLISVLIVFAYYLTEFFAQFKHKNIKG
ncbi:MAG TPA: MFS transporter [Gammaproteobacteria bacterium]|nr:MFS transporter [Gammaproteobacteria bacterium]